MSDGYWLRVKPQHGYTCTCPETDQHEEQTLWIEFDEDGHAPRM